MPALHLMHASWSLQLVLALLLPAASGCSLYGVRYQPIPGEEHVVSEGCDYNASFSGDSRCHGRGCGGPPGLHAPPGPAAPAAAIPLAKFHPVPTAPVYTPWAVAMPLGAANVPSNVAATASWRGPDALRHLIGQRDRLRLAAEPPQLTPLAGQPSPQ